MTTKTIVPPESNTISQEPRTKAALLGPYQSAEYGEQLSSYTEIKQGKKSRTLFAVSDSPLKGE